MLVLVLPPVSSRVSGFPVASPCLWGKLQNLSFCHVANCENWRTSRTKCWFFCIHWCVLSRVAGFPVASPCLWRKLENLSFSNVSEDVVMWFWVADVTFSDIPTCLMMFTKCQNWRKSRRKCCFFLHPRVLSRVSRFPVASPCPWGKLRTPHSTLYTPHSTIYTLDSTLYTLHSTLYTLHFTLLTPYLRLYTPHSTRYTLYTPHSTLYTPHSLLHTPHSTLYTFHSTLQTGNTGNMYKTVQINYCRKYCAWLHNHVFWHLYHWHTCEHSGSWASSCFSIYWDHQPVYIYIYIYKLYVCTHDG